MCKRVYHPVYPLHYNAFLFAGSTDACGVVLTNENYGSVDLSVVAKVDGIKEKIDTITRTLVLSYNVFTVTESRSTLRKKQVISEIAASF